MVPNSRQACLKSSFALVLYAISLLISQYIFSLDLTDQELPLVIGNIDLQEIGFKKYHYFSYEPLGFKVSGKFSSIQSLMLSIFSLYHHFFCLSLSHFPMSCQILTFALHKTPHPLT